MYNLSLPQLIDPSTGQRLKESAILDFVEFYDSRPVLFVLETPQKVLFIGVWIDEKLSFFTRRTKVYVISQTWLYVKISSARFEAVKQRTIALQDVFSKTEDGMAYYVEFDYRTQSTIISKIFCRDIPDYNLPRD
jgi:hypothetical protein